MKKNTEDKSFLLTNIENESTYTENNFDCIINYKDLKADSSIDGYNLLSYLGVSLTGSYSDAGSVTNTDITIADAAAGGRSLTFTPLNKGVYYEIQARYTDSSYDWTDVSPAIDIHDGMLAADGSVSSLKVANDLFTASNNSLEIRALEWNTSNITTNINALRLTNESPDSLILKSNGDKFYDESKFEHSVTNTSVAVVTDDPNSFDPDVDVMNLVGDANKYLSLASHRSFDIQNGNFSMEFWIKPDSSHSGTGYIAQRGEAFQILYSSNTIKLNVNGDTYLESTALSTTNWSHIAITARINRRTRDIDLSLFVDGAVLKSANTSVSYGDLSGPNEEGLIIGKGLKAYLYGLRIYIGKSNYREDFTKPTAPFEKEANPRSYKILKYESSRRASSCNWVINKNTFNNVSPPSDYKDVVDEAETFYMSEWLAASSTTQERSSSYNRAVINYINGYAYSAPNNPHINKNYEGTAITKASDIDTENLVFDNYEYVDRSAGDENKKPPLPAPYLYEHTKGNDLDLVRLHKKGGYDMELDDQFSSATFNKASRLRITKYVYKLYTKRAVVVGDVGYKGNRGYQSGWTYQLQYKDSGDTWTDLASDSTDQVENIFYNNEYVSSPTPDGFGNISSFNSLPVVLLKTDITKKYKPEDIEFRIIKKQNLNLGSTGDTGKVIKKLNFLPLEVDIPSANCLLDMTQQSEHSQIDGTNEAEVKLDPDRVYILIKDEGEGQF